MRPRTLLTMAGILAFIAILTWSTLSAQKVSCEVCVSFNGKEQCGTASHASEPEAVRSAQTAACGPVSHGMNEIIACESRPPVTKKCKSL